MIGYIIKNKNDDTLTQNLFWYSRNENEELGFVFSENALENIKIISFDWLTKPYSYQKAEYNKISSEVKYIDNDIKYF